MKRRIQAKGSKRRFVKKETRLHRGELMHTVHRVIVLALMSADAVDDLDLIASLERLDALAFHETTNFLKAIVLEDV